MQTVTVTGIEKSAKDVAVKFEVDGEGKRARHQMRSYAEFAAYVGVMGGKHPGIILPTLPLIQTSSTHVLENERLVIAGFQKWLDYALTQEPIAQDSETRQFLRGDFGYIPETNAARRAPGAFQVSRTKLAGEQDDELTLAKRDMMKFATTMGHVAKAIDYVGTSRRSMMTSLVEASDALGEYAAENDASGDHALGAALRKVSALFRRNTELVNSQTVGDQVVLGDTTAYEAANALAARDALVHRDLLIDEQRAAVNKTLAQRRAIDRIQETHGPGAPRLDAAVQDFRDASAHENALTDELVATTRELAPQYRAHMARTFHSVVDMLQTHAEKNLKIEERLLSDIAIARKDVHQVRESPQNVRVDERVPARRATDAPVNPRPSRLDAKMAASMLAG